jgi:hypothetical protein
MRGHAKSDAHIHYSETEVLSAKAEKDGSILQQLQSVTEEQRIKKGRVLRHFCDVLTCFPTPLTLLLLLIYISSWLIQKHKPL